MAVNENDNLSNILSEWRLDDREVAWLWLTLKTNRKFELADCQLNSATMREEIYKVMSQEPALRWQLNRAKATAFLPEEAFKWIDKAGRQPRWLTAQAKKELGVEVVSSVFQMLTDKAKLIALFDLWDESFDEKERTLRELSNGWNRLLRSDKLFSWFKDDDEHEKCALAWSWMEKNKSWLTWQAAPFTKLNEMLEFFDHSGASDEEKELYVDKIKRRWSTQKTREKAVKKKQYNFVLPLSVNAVLDKLAEEHELSRTKVLEMLILGEEQHELYLPKQPSR
ncbi:Uncharacterised protein [Ectopseudomonas mendocina]|uniref:Uncharacterized protein n=1 Tax=Ectopseudomonas mendocina TaxID=300 RepID=A0A379IUD3_ECTME|nr:hypothetical protein [Pseudomonas mendocina]SUD39766.1 Uncharacterised protein [Pseudomonas mendocina]